MVEKQFKANEIIFREGEVGECFYQLKEGFVGIFANYGTDDEVKLTELKSREYFGEMAVIEAYPRSATAVALTDGTKADEISMKEVDEYFKAQPDKILDIMKHLGTRVRQLTDDYTEVSETIEQLHFVKKEERSESLLGKIKKFAHLYRNASEIQSVESLRKSKEVSHKEGFHNSVENYSKGTILFKEGEIGNCMYDIHAGSVSIYKAYGTPEEKLLTELYSDKFFGEIGMIGNETRSATAVIASDDTVLETIYPDDLQELFEKNPPKVWMILAHLSYRLRRLTNEYISACKLVSDYSEAEEKNDTISGELKNKTANYQAKLYD